MRKGPRLTSSSGRVSGFVLFVVPDILFVYLCECANGREWREEKGKEAKEDKERESNKNRDNRNCVAHLFYLYSVHIISHPS